MQHQGIPEGRIIDGETAVMILPDRLIGVAAAHKCEDSGNLCLIPGEILPAHQRFHFLESVRIQQVFGESQDPFRKPAVINDRG